jgi:hypothetical protein
MMSTAVRTIMLALVATACAQGGNGTGEPSDAGGSGNDAKPVDGPSNPGNDAPIQPIDAALPIDAAPVLPDGAPPGSNLFCSVNADCTNAGECCFNFGGAFPTSFCVIGSPIIPGTETCFPDQ